MRSPAWRFVACGSVCLLSLGAFGCRYADFRMPELAPAEPQVRYEWQAEPAPVLPRGAGGEPDSHDALNPSIVRRGNAYFNFYSGFDGRTWRTLLATSSDGFVWKKQGVVLAPDGAAEGQYIAANGSAVYGHNSFWYWYQSGPKGAPRIGLAQSGDGHQWRRVAFPVLDHGPLGSWDERGVADPYVLRVEGYFYMFYLGQDRAQRQRLGLARSLDGVKWQKLRTNPILELGRYGAFDEAGLGEPAVWIGHGYYWMLYAGRDIHESRRLGFARSIDGVHWEKLPPAIAGGQPWDSQVVCDPTIELIDGRLAAWFGGGDAPSPDENLNGQIGVAYLHATGTPERLSK